MSDGINDGMNGRNTGIAYEFVPVDLREEYKRLAAVRREIGDYSSATRSTVEDMRLIERIARLEAQNAKLREALEKCDKAFGRINLGVLEADVAMDAYEAQKQAHAALQQAKESK